MKKTKFLILRLSSIGDIVLTSPLVRCLKNQVEGAEIHFVTKSKYGDLLTASPYIDKVHYLNDHLGRLLQELKAEKFDHIIDLHQNFRSLIIKMTLRVPSSSVNKLNLRKWLLVRFKTDLLPDQHIVDRYFRTVAKFNVTYDGQGLDYFIPGEEEYDSARLPEAFHPGYVAFIIGGTYSTKRLPTDRILAICQALKYPVILIGGVNEKEEGAFISRNSGDHVLNMVGKTSMNESAGLVKNARVVLTNDTGMMHIAAAFKKKILSFWGNTIPKFGMSPFSPHPASKIMETQGLSCRPCSKLGFRKCPREHFRCMRDLDISEAIRWVNENYRQEEGKTKNEKQRTKNEKWKRENGERSRV